MTPPKASDHIWMLMLMCEDRLWLHGCQHLADDCMEFGCQIFPLYLRLGVTNSWRRFAGMQQVHRRLGVNHRSNLLTDDLCVNVGQIKCA